MAGRGDLTRGEARRSTGREDAWRRGGACDTVRERKGSGRPGRVERGVVEGRVGSGRTEREGATRWQNAWVSTARRAGVLKVLIDPRA